MIVITVVTDAHPTDPLPCVDVLPNCAQYTQSACKDPYIPLGPGQLPRLLQPVQ